MTPGHDAQSFDEIAETYDRRSEIDGDGFGEWLETVLPAKGGRALDIGCGTGRHAVRLADHFEHVDAIDLSGPMIEVAKRERARPNVTYRAADLFDVTGKYDVVVSVAMLHHVDDLEAALAHIATLVAPGGIAYLADLTAFRPRLPRWFFRLGAIKQLAADVIRRRAHARERLRHATHRPWLDHLASDRYLSRREFEERYGAALPGATFTTASYLDVCCWTAS